MRVRILWFLNPFCHLVIGAVRVDSPPYLNSTHSFAELLIKYRLKSGFSRITLAAKMGVSVGTLKNWERERAKPNMRFWPSIRLLLTTEAPPFR